MDDEQIDGGLPQWCELVSGRYLELLADSDTSHWQAAPGAAETLEELSHRARIVLMTGNPEPIARARMERLGLAPFFPPGQGAFGCDAEHRVDLIRSRARARGRRPRGADVGSGRHASRRRGRARRRDSLRRDHARALRSRGARRRRRGRRRLPRSPPGSFPRLGRMISFARGVPGPDCLPIEEIGHVHARRPPARGARRAAVRAALGLPAAPPAPRRAARRRTGTRLRLERLAPGSRLPLAAPAARRQQARAGRGAHIRPAAEDPQRPRRRDHRSAHGRRRPRARGARGHEACVPVHDSDLPEPERADAVARAAATRWSSLRRSATCS